jgi:hypothetical protein
MRSAGLMTQQHEMNAADDAMRSALQAGLRSRISPGARIDRLERRRSPYSSSYAIDELDVYLQDDACLRLVVKDLSPRAMLAEARRAKPEWLCDPEREIDVYRDVLEPLGIEAPRLYGALIDPQTPRYWLFLERVEAPLLTQLGDWQTWLAAASWLATMHTRLKEETSRWPRRAIRCDRSFYRRWLPRAIRAGDRAEIGDLAAVAAAYEGEIDRLANMDCSLIHGEFYPSNILIRQGPGGPRVCPIDWEMSAIAPPLMDLAALTAGRWTEDQRLELLRSYRYAAGAGLGLPESEEALTRDLARCRLHLAIRWLGWSADWTPPSDHAHDWLGEARSAAAILGFDLSAWSEQAA